MSDIGSMVAELIAAGASPEAAARVVAEAFVAGSQASKFRGIPPDATTEKRRAYDRERKAKRAEIRRNSTGNPPTSENASLSKDNTIEDSKPKREANRGIRLPENWEPPAADLQAATALIGATRADDELQKFRDHWKAQPGSKGVKTDWPATWRNWYRRSGEYRGTINGQRNFNANRRSGGNDFFAGVSSLAADIAGDGQPSRPADPEIPLGRFNIDG